MKKQLGLLVAIIGLAVLTSCGNEATEQGQDQQTEQTQDQVQQEIAPAMDSVAVDTTK